MWNIFFPKSIISEFNLQKDIFSLEKEFFPNMLFKNKKIKIFKSRANFIDIGTPLSLQYFKIIIKYNDLWFFK